RVIAKVIELLGKDGIVANVGRTRGHVDVGLEGHATILAHGQEIGVVRVGCAVRVPLAGSRIQTLIVPGDGDMPIRLIHGNIRVILAGSPLVIVDLNGGTPGSAVVVGVHQENVR